LRKKACRQVTADRQALINELVDLIYDFLPLNSHSLNAVTFRTIFRESKIYRYLERGSNKTQKLQNGFTNLYRYHERLPWTIIRKIVPASINYRRHKKTPLTQAEIEKLSNILFDLGIDMRKELADIEIDETLPRITVPPDELKERLKHHDLVPQIAGEPLQLFKDGHFNEAARKACEVFEDVVRRLSGSDKYGRPLMGETFKDGSLLNTEQIQPLNRKDFADGYRHLTMGVMAAVKNIFGHGNEERRSPEECYEMLLFLNWLYRYLAVD
jgi:uncharacterized protein (TIGR02391 family)